MNTKTQSSPRVRAKLALRGAVQGVGFRPFVHRLATEMTLAGCVNNSSQGVTVEIEGARPALEKFLFRLETEKPSHCVLQSMAVTWLDAVGMEHFEIRASETGGEKSTLVLPDLATCPDCQREIFDPQNRRFHYPFTNCTNCGPRFSIIEALPYDRANTSMKQFAMCPACQAEYDDPHDRRFHAQPNACPVCGPQIEYWNGEGENIFGGHVALRAAASAIRRGKIIAVKGIGGFHLMVDARNEKVVQLLRTRKSREEKPFALMVPAMESVREICEISPLERELLCSSAAPIVLMRRNKKQNSARKIKIAENVAPNNANLGVMLPSNPLHHLLMAELNFPVVATSGNLGDEPICTDEIEALKRLRGLADFFLVHNRPIVRHEDDSIVKMVMNREMILRRARGYAPLPINISVAADVSRLKTKNEVQSEPPHVGTYETILAVGAHLKNSIALAVGENVFISQHIGDLETEEADKAFRRSAADLPKLYGIETERIAADLHPDYRSTRFAMETRKQIISVQHHVAHVLSCIAENQVQLPALGVAWDGTGFGTDGTIWGGEFFLVTRDQVERVAHLRPFRLPGGDKAVKEPRRAALGILYELYGERAFELEHLASLQQMSPVEKITLKGMLQRRFNSPLTSSVGRLFDVVASLTDLRQRMQFEGQAAMELEFALDGITTKDRYDLPLVTRHASLTLDWSLLVHSVLADVSSGVSTAEISAKFHNALAEAVVAVAKKIGQPRVVLSGGCFQNRYLTERTVARLREENFKPYWHQRVPTNDGGIALGQIFAVRNNLHLK